MGIEELRALLVAARTDPEPAPPDSWGARIVEFLVRGEITAAEAMCALASAATCLWLATTPVETLALTPTYAAMSQTAGQRWWLAYDLAAVLLAILSFVTRNKLLRATNAVGHVGLFAGLTFAILSPGVPVLAGYLFAVFAVGAFWSALRLFARMVE